MNRQVHELFSAAGLDPTSFRILLREVHESTLTELHALLVRQGLDLAALVVLGTIETRKLERRIADLKVTT